MVTSSSAVSDPMRKAAIRAAVILAVGLICAGASWQWRQASTATQTAFQRQMNHLRSEVARLRQDKQWTQTYQSNYQHLVDRGLVGTESRLEWRALIIAAAQQLHLPDVKMSFTPKQLRKPTTLDDQSDDHDALISAYSSQMSFDLSLFHSLDLLPLLDTLDHSASAILMPVRCSLEMAKDPLYLGADPQVKSRCDLDWITIAPSPVDSY